MLHPLTHIAIALAFALIAVSAPVEEGLAALLFGLVMTLTIPRRTETMLARPLLKVLAIALLFLVLMHGVHWSPFGFFRMGLFEALESFIRIGAPVAAVLYLSRQIRSEELFSLLLDLRIPPVAILILFRTLWLVPRFTERMDETLIALKLRGMPAET
ncbi:MAG: energy-coupling factor transporter transmembrane component T family protein, partial [Candidatus Latescibacterota bacterium]